MTGRGTTPERAALAAKVARLHRAEPDLTWREVGLRLGISAKSAGDLWNDPDGSRARARKDSYKVPCPNCGKPMGGSKRNDGTKHCADCSLELQRAQRFWTRDRIIESFQDFHARYGRSPTVVDVMYRNPSVAARMSEARIAEAEAVSDNKLPRSVASVTDLFGSWPAALEAAGLPVSRGGQPRHRAEPRRDSRDDALVAAVADGYTEAHLVAAVTGRGLAGTTQRLAKLVRDGRLTRTRDRGRYARWRYEIPDSNGRPA